MEETVKAKTVSVDEAAAELGISRALAYRAVARGEIPSFRIGKRILVPRARLDRLVLEFMGGPQERKADGSA
jgi:excisionase family DNA binding protein